MNVLLSTTYFGPVQWYQKLYRADETWIECCESFLKQTYRNRCVIATTQGVQALTVPVERSGSSIIRDIRISDHGSWRHLHWNALKSAYGESPFFEYYEDDLRPFFERRWDYLLDFNEAIRQKLCELLDIHPTVHLTTAFTPPSTTAPQTQVAVPQAQVAVPQTQATAPLTSGCLCCGVAAAPPPHDLRYAIAPKHPAPDADFHPRRYYQVYEAKHGFQPNLSIVDLLFNMGPESVFWL